MDYYPYKVAGCFLYFTSHCIIRAEPFHAHASNEEHSESASVKFFIHADGSCDVMNNEPKKLSDKQISQIASFIAENYLEMYRLWQSRGGGEFYGTKTTSSHKFKTNTFIKD